jgi:ligand-binding sensor domain-containing protein
MHCIKWTMLVLVIGLVLLTISPLSLQAHTFTPFGVANGLEARMAASMIIDKDGFLWVASREGLFRYDGYNAHAFHPELGERGSISDNDLRTIYEDGEGIIWVGTNTGGLNSYDPESRQFKVYRHDSADPGSILDDSINGISDGPDGGLWVSTQLGLSRLDRETDRFEHFVHDPDDAGSLSNNWAYSLHLGHSDKLWVSTVGGGVNRWNPETRSFIRFDLSEMTLGPKVLNDVFAIILGFQGHRYPFGCEDDPCQDNLAVPCP